MATVWKIYVNIILQSVVIVKSVVFIKTHMLELSVFLYIFVLYSAKNKLPVNHQLKEITCLKIKLRKTLIPVPCIVIYSSIFVLCEFLTYWPERH